jgi:hypothetical protein
MGLRRQCLCGLIQGVPGADLRGIERGSLLRDHWQRVRRDARMRRRLPRGMDLRPKHVQGDAARVHLGDLQD